MSIIDAEFQFDRHKLTYFFEADKYVYDILYVLCVLNDLYTYLLFSLYRTGMWISATWYLNYLVYTRLEFGWHRWIPLPSSPVITRV